VENIILQWWIFDGFLTTFRFLNIKSLKKR
jgi:hypothetical protein